MWYLLANKKLLVTKVVDLGAVQLLRNALGGRGVDQVWHFMTGGGGRPSVT